MVNKNSWEIHLINRPKGLPQINNFELVSKKLPAISENEILIKNLWMSVDPYMRGRMNDKASFIEPFTLNTPLEGAAIGEIICSNHPDYPVGSKVSSMNGWREQFISDGSDIQLLPDSTAPIQAFLSVMGMPGFTAYTGLITLAGLKPGDNVFVSAASGSVGAVVCQIAKLHGCYVSGSVGSEEKARYLLEEIGVDAVVNYKKATNLKDEIARANPEGIDVYFENVGGEHLEATLDLMNDFGRITLCGMISSYNAESPMPGPGNLEQIIHKRLSVKGFICTDHLENYPSVIQEISQWVNEGKLTWKESTVEGIAQAPAAFIGLFSGSNFGKMLVKLD